MYTSFGIEFCSNSTRWDDILKGPSTAASLAHVRKILRFKDQLGGPAAEAAKVARDKIVPEQSLDETCPVGQWPQAAE
jgi:hypothetical protein